MTTLRIVTDFSEVIDAFDDFIEGAVERRITEALELLSDEVAKRAKAVHDYQDRTQGLTASIQPGQVFGSFGQGLSINIEAGNLGRVTYARYIEEGTRHIRPRMFLASALEHVEPRSSRIMEQALSRALRDSGL